jgi:ABC-type branched-subunit amino acid transport system ATPase component
MRHHVQLTATAQGRSLTPLQLPMPTEATMPADFLNAQQQQLEQSKGAVEVLAELHEEMELWREEAASEVEKETLDNVSAHLAEMLGEYRRRTVELAAALKARN